MAMLIKGGKRLIYVVTFALLVLAAAWFFNGQPRANANTEPTQDSSSALTSAAIDVKSALAPRTIGDARASVTIEEFASLTCGHCAHFNKEIFAKLKEKYIDTGKVRFTYSDFPLNAPALEAAMIARCLPADRYFQFIKFLFETQDQWAFSKDYRAALKQNSKLLGLSDESYDACAASADLKSGLVSIMEAAGKAHEISSTPTFIINGKEKISGAQDLSAFEKIIDPLLEAN